MTVIAPPEPQHEEHHDLEALIREARRRTLRRRLKYAAAALGAVLVGGGIFAGLELAGSGRTGPAVPPGYELVHAKGVVEHAVIVIRSPDSPVVVDPGSGSAQPAEEVWDAWFDRKTGLERVRDTIAGREQYDVSGRTQCIPAGPRVEKGFCLPPGSPFDLTNRGFVMPLKRDVVREIGRGTLDGRDVIWVAQLTNGKLQPDADRAAIDARTHRLVDYRRMFHGRVVYEQIYRLLDTVPGADVDFVVRKRGGPSHSWPPAPPTEQVSTRQGLAAASNALGRPPLWLGRHFQGSDLRAIRVETQKVAGASVRFVTLDYGKVSLLEIRPDERAMLAPFTGNPTPGRILLAYGAATVIRDGLLVQARPAGTAHEAVALVSSLTRRAG